jgi:uncharacterized protein YheU (UPF0270 family)
MMDDGEDADRRGIELPPDALSPEALRDLVEEFVTRDGTDYGAVERGVEEKAVLPREVIDRGRDQLVVSTRGGMVSDIVLGREIIALKLFEAV